VESYFEDVVNSCTIAIRVLEQIVALWDHMWPHLVINAASPKFHALLRLLESQESLIGIAHGSSSEKVSTFVIGVRGGRQKAT